MQAADELRDAVDAYLGRLPLWPELGRLEESMRYSLESGGKRVRPVLCLAVAEAAGGEVEYALPAAGAVELVHTFSLVHDDLPALDDDDERRGRPSAHVAFGEGVALLAGDALLAEAVRLALSYDDPALARELVEATLGMIGGQHRDITGDDEDLTAVEHLKTGRLFAAAVGLGLRAARLPEDEQAPWREFGDELGLLFQAWTTSSTATASPRGSARKARASSRTPLRAEPTHASTGCRPRLPCCGSSSIASPPAPVEGGHRRRSD